MNDSTTLRSHTRTAPETDADRFWKLVLADLKLQMTRYTFETWLKQTRAIDLTERDLTVQVPDPAVKAWLENRLNRKIQRTVDYHAGQPVHIRYASADDHA